MLGAFLGAWISRALNFDRIPDLTVGVTRFPVLWSVVGAVLLVAAAGLFARSR